MNNHIYNLMCQLNEEQKSYWRITNNYIKDAGDCTECVEFLEKLQQDKEQHVEELTELLKKHLC